MHWASLLLGRENGFLSFLSPVKVKRDKEGIKFNWILFEDRPASFYTYFEGNPCVRRKENFYVLKKTFLTNRIFGMKESTRIKQLCYSDLGELNVGTVGTDGIYKTVPFITTNKIQFSKTLLFYLRF